MTGDERGDGARGDRGRGPDLPGGPVVTGTVDLDDAAFGTPSCPACVRRMEPASTPSGGVYWTCAHCGQTRLA